MQMDATARLYVSRKLMIHSRFAILCVLVGCGGASPAASISIPIPKSESAKTTAAKTDLGRASSHGKWWTRLSVDGANRYIELHPDERGGVRAFVETGSVPNVGERETKAALIDLDVAGHEIRSTPVIEGIVVDTGRVAFGDNDEMVFAGAYQNEVGISGTKVTDPHHPSRTNRLAMYLVAIDGRARLAWSHTFYDAGVQSIARRSDGIVVVSGTSNRQSDFGGGVIGNVGAFPTFIAAFDAHGNHLFSRAFHTQNGGAPPTVAFASDGTILLFTTLGQDVSQIDFGDGPHREIKSQGTAMARFDRRGNCLESSIISMVAKRVAVGASDDIVIAGETTEHELNQRSQLVVRVDEAGHEVWRHAFPSDALGCRCVPVAVDAHGNALTAILSPSDGEGGLWEDVVAFDRAGAEIYKKRMLGDVMISDIAFSSTGDAFVAGQTLRKDLEYEGDVLPAQPRPGMFVMRIPAPVLD